MESIKSKIAAYKKCKLNDKRLQVELHEEQEKMAALERDILTQNPLLITFIHENYIRKVPTEILSMIFTYFVQGQPTHIRRPLLVCRQWFNIIMNSPLLWTHIQIIAKTTFDQSQLLSRSTYVQACIERSQERLLNISVDYEQCNGLERHFTALIRDQVAGLLKDIPSDTLVDVKKVRKKRSIISRYLDLVVIGEDTSDPEIWSDEDTSYPEIWSDDSDTENQRDKSFDHWIANIPWYKCTAKRQLAKYYLLPLQHLVGRGGEVMKRWESIKITFPSDVDLRGSNGIVAAAMQRFTYPTPFLKSISLKYGEHPRPRKLALFPETPLLTTLRLLTDIGYTILPSIDYSQIVDLHVHIRAFDQLQSISLSKRLRRLGLILSTVASFEHDIPDGFTLEFPHLQELLCGSIPLCLRGVIHVPRLETLHLTDRHAFNSMEGCTFISSVKRLLITPNLSQLQSMEDTEVPTTISGFVSLKEICVRPVDKEEMEEVLLELRKSGHLPLLQTLVLGESFEDFEEKIDYIS